MDFAVSADHRMKRKESEKIDKYPHLPREQKNTKHEGGGYTICN